MANKKATYTDIYSTIMALRFLGQEQKTIEKKRILQSFKHMLDRPDYADLVIPDLARWEDWSAMDRLVELFKTTKDESAWVRVPVIQYLMACPLPKAKAHLKELEKIDPESVPVPVPETEAGTKAATKSKAAADGAKAADGTASDRASDDGEAAAGSPLPPRADDETATAPLAASGSRNSPETQPLAAPASGFRSWWIVRWFTAPRPLVRWLAAGGILGLYLVYVFVSLRRKKRQANA
jgi:hypothetical protein